MSDPSVASSPAVVGLARSSRRGKGLLAMCATLLVPGLGHLLAGRARRAWTWMCIALGVILVDLLALLVPRLAIALVILLPCTAVVALVLLIDAYVIGHISARPMLGRVLSRYALGLVVLPVVYFASPFQFATQYVRSHWVDAVRITDKSMDPILRPGEWVLIHHMLGWRRWTAVQVIPPGRTPAPSSAGSPGCRAKRSRSTAARL